MRAPTSSLRRCSCDRRTFDAWESSGRPFCLLRARGCLRRVLLLATLLAVVGVALLWRSSIGSRPMEPEPPIAESPRATHVHEIEPPLVSVDRRPSMTGGAADRAIAFASPEPRLTGELQVSVVSRETGKPVAEAEVSVSSGSSDFELELETDSRGSVVGNAPPNEELVAKIEAGTSHVSSALIEPLAPGERRRIEVDAWTEEHLVVVVWVLDAENDAPIAGARVACESLPDGRSVGTFTTTPEGRVSIALPATKPCRALVDADGYAVRQVRLADGMSGGATSRDVRLQRAASLAVRVLDERGVGSEGLAVVLETQPSWTEERGTAFSRNMDRRLQWEARTDTDGTCAFQALPPEVPLEMLVTRGDERVWCEGRPVTLAPGELREIELRIGTGCTIRGHLLDQHGDPVTGETVSLLAADGRATMPIPYYDDPSTWTTTDASGNFTFPNVPAGSWWVGPDRARVAALPELVSLQPGAPDLEVVLHGYRDLTIEGHIVDPNGAPVRGVTLGVGSGWYTSDQDGAFQIGPLLPGTHELRINSESFGYASPEPTIEAGATDVVIELLRGGSLACTVRDAAGRRVDAWLELAPGGRSRMTGGEGPLFKGLRPGKYSVVASTSDGCAVAQHVSIEAERVTELSLELAPAAQLVVRCLGEGLYGRYEVWFGSALVAEDIIAGGTRRTCSVPPGVLRVVVSFRGETQEKTVQAQAGELVELAFE